MKFIQDILIQTEAAIIEELGLNKKVTEKSPLQANAINILAQDILALWETLNLDRPLIQKPRKNSSKGHYLTEKRFQRAYLGGYCLPNIARTQVVLNQQNIKTSLRTLLQDCIKEREALHILDVGCGPLSASLGALSVIFELTKEEKTPPFEIFFHCVDRSAEMRDWGERLLKQVLTHHPQWADFVHTLGYETVHEVTVQPRLVLIANVLNENAPLKAREILGAVYELCAPRSAVVIIEPGQDQHSQRLGSLRDDLVATATSEARHLRILGPCLHLNPCPLSEKTGRSDWCWFRAAWQLPNLVRDLDALTGLDHSKLNYSYVSFLFCKEKSFAGFPKLEKAFARVVSDPIQLNGTEKVIQYFKSHLLSGNKAELLQELGVGEAGGGTLLKELLCTYLGTLEAGLQGRGAKKTSRRGALVLTKDDLPLRASERARSKKDQGNNTEEYPSRRSKQKGSRGY